MSFNELQIGFTFEREKEERLGGRRKEVKPYDKKRFQPYELNSSVLISFSI
jgi:hypothetical protein